MDEESVVTKEESQNTSKNEAYSEESWQYIFSIAEADKDL